MMYICIYLSSKNNFILILILILQNMYADISTIFDEIVPKPH